MQTKINDYKQKIADFSQRLSDVRFLGQVVFGVIVLLITWSGVKSIESNYALQKQIAGIKQQNSVQQLQNNNLALQNQYFNTNQYLELSARQNFGLAAPGEKEIVVPAAVAQKYTTVIISTAPEAKASSHQPAYQRHFQAWVDFFLHRSANAN